MCYYPRLVRNPKYTANNKNGGNIPAVTDQRVLYVPIGCGQCKECRKQKSREWKIRLLEDIKIHKHAKFVTLTFSNESYKEFAKESNLTGYALDNYIATRALRLSLENWRKKYKKSLRHWLVTELGHNGTENVHLHGILYIEDVMEIDTFWKYGYTWKGNPIRHKGQIVNYRQYVSAKTINYIVKYVTKIDTKHQAYKNIILTSPGIGREYTSQPDKKKVHAYKNNETNETYKTAMGNNIALPI
jgi:hypothetical protein